VPMSVHNSWSLIRSQLSTLESISISRLVIGGSGVGKICTDLVIQASRPTKRAFI